MPASLRLHIGVYAKEHFALPWGDNVVRSDMLTVATCRYQTEGSGARHPGIESSVCSGFCKFVRVVDLDSSC